MLFKMGYIFWLFKSDPPALENWQYIHIWRSVLFKNVLICKPLQLIILTHFLKVRKAEAEACSEMEALHSYDRGFSNAYKTDEVCMMDWHLKTIPSKVLAIWGNLRNNNNKKQQLPFNRPDKSELSWGDIDDLCDSWIKARVRSQVLTFRKDDRKQDVL